MGKTLFAVVLGQMLVACTPYHPKMYQQRAMAKAFQTQTEGEVSVYEFTSNSLTRQTARPLPPEHALYLVFSSDSIEEWNATSTNACVFSMYMWGHGGRFAFTPENEHVKRTEKSRHKETRIENAKALMTGRINIDEIFDDVPTCGGVFIGRRNHLLGFGRKTPYSGRIGAICFDANPALVYSSSNWSNVLRFASSHLELINGHL